MHPFAALFLSISLASPITHPVAAAAQNTASAAQRQQSSQQAAPTPIMIAPPVVELGAIEPGSVHPAKFTIINTGKQEVTITSAKPNCKCTAISDVAGKKIPAGGSVELSASLSAPRAPGIKEAAVFLTFDGGLRPLQATIRGDVRFKIVAEPPYCDALKDVVRGTVKLKAVDGQPFRILEAGKKAPVLTNFDVSKDKPRAEYELQWDFTGVSCEQMPLWLFVWTDRADCRVLPLRVRDECTGSTADMDRYKRFWILKEQFLDGGTSKGGKPVEVEIELEHYNPPKRGAVERADWSKVVAVRSRVSELDVRYVSQREVVGGGAMIKLELTPKKQGSFEGELELETATGVGRFPVVFYAE